MSPRVLVVDDNLSNRKMLGRLLEAEGYIVDRAGDARSALELAQAAAPDIVLQDLVLPDMDGLALGRALRAMGLTDTPLVVISGFVSRFPDVLRDESNYAAAIAKPIDFDEVLGHLRDLLATKLHSMHPVEATPDTAGSDLSALDIAALSRRHQAQRERIGLLANLTEVISARHDDDQALRDVLGACVEAASAKTGALYLHEGGRLHCRARAGRFAAVDDGATSFFGHPERFEELIRGTALPTPLRAEVPVDRAILEAAGADHAIFIPISRERRNVAALFLAGDVLFERDLIPFARALGAHMVALLSLSQAFRAVARSDARYRAIVAQSRSGIIVTDDGGRMTQVNPAATTILGAEPGELLGARLRKFIRSAPRLEELSAEPRPSQRTMNLRSPTGEDRIVEVVASPIDHVGEQSMLVIINDITESQHLRQQVIFQDKLATMGTLAASVAHEINNPMTSVLHNLEIIEARLREAQDGLKPEDVADCLHVVEDSLVGVERVRSMAGVLQGYARTDGERTLLEVSKVIDDAIRLVGGALCHQVKIERRYEEAPPVAGNAGKLGQVFTNLIVNALHALTATSGPRLDIHIRRVGEHVVADIQDNGSGIAPKDLGRIFDPYFTTKPEGVGTGLGLPICRQIISEHGGTISASSHSRGTTFTVVLPLPSPEELGLLEARANAYDSPPPPVDRGSGERARLLIIDDEPRLLGPLARLLATEYEVVTSTSGAEAWAMIDDAMKGSAEAPFDVIVSDIAMPGVDGIQLYERVLAAAPRLASRFIFSTGGALTPRTEAFLAAWHGPTLRKPYPIKEVRDLVAIVLREGTVQP